VCPASNVTAMPLESTLLVYRGHCVLSENKVPSASIAMINNDN